MLLLLHPAASTGVLGQMVALGSDTVPRAGAGMWDGPSRCKSHLPLRGTSSQPGVKRVYLEILFFPQNWNIVEILRKDSPWLRADGTISSEAFGGW